MLHLACLLRFLLLSVAHVASLCPDAGALQANTASNKCPHQADASFVPCRSACALVSANPLCSTGGLPASLPCGVYSCRDIFGAQHYCDPARDAPRPEPESSHLPLDAFGCDAQVASAKPWAKQRCLTQTWEEYSNTTCLWVMDIKSWSQVPGQVMCGDGSVCNTTDDVAAGGGASCCNTRGGRSRCPTDFPYMCEAADQCADNKDRCCLSIPDRCNTPSHKGLRQCNTTVTRSSTTCALDGCLTLAQLNGGQEATCAAVSERTAIEHVSSSSSSSSSSFSDPTSRTGATGAAPGAASDGELRGRKYQQVMREYLVDLKCLSCVRNGCNYCQILDRSNASHMPPPTASNTAHVLDALLSTSKGGATTSAVYGTGGNVGEGVLRLSPRSSCVKNTDTCSKLPRYARGDSVGVLLTREAHCYRSPLHYAKYLAEQQLPRTRRFFSNVLKIVTCVNWM